MATTKETTRLAELRQKRRNERDDQIKDLDKEYGYIDTDPDLVAKYEEMTKLSVKELQQRLTNKNLKAEELMKACIWKSLKVHKGVNCITEFVEDAVDKAKELDKLPKPKGPLHGIPFCVKDDTAMTGYDCTLGCARKLYQPEQETAVIVQTLELLGAIPFCRTNVPQTCCSSGSHNPIFGKTLNPLNKLSPGGSSSGTAALVAGFGSPFGTGADTGGSLRLPAHFCGLATLKATSNRISRRGCKRCTESVASTPGILVRSAEDLTLIFEGMLLKNLQNRLDPLVVPVPWNESIFRSEDELHIGYLSSTAFAVLFPCIGDTIKAIDKAIEVLKSNGHTLQLFPYLFPEPKLGDIFFDHDCKPYMQALLKDDEVSESMQPLYDRLCKESVDASYLHYGRERLIHDFLDKMREHDLDAILCPAFPFPAIDYEHAPDIERAFCYNFIWNWLDCPAGVVKVLKESGKNWKISIDGLTKPKPCKDAFLRDADKCVGMPIGVQIVGKPYREEVVLRIMMELEKGSRE